MNIKINDEFSIKDDKGYSWMLIHTTHGISPKTGEIGTGTHRTWYATAQDLYEQALEKGMLESDATSFAELIEVIKRLHADFNFKLDEIEARIAFKPKLKAKSRRKKAIPEQRTSLESTI